MNVWYVNSILGTFRLEEENDAICGLTLCPDGVPELEPLPRKVCETPLLQEAEEQLNEYFAGARREFDLPLAPKGTPFQKAVWAEMCRIPYGETRTYGQLAAAVGKPKASRAVGGACHCNPIAILQPCHRVVGSTGKLTGYAYGVEMKPRSLWAFSAENLFYICVSEKPAGFSETLFHRRVAVGNCIIHKRAIAHPFCATALYFSLRFTVHCKCCPSSRNYPRCTWRGCAGR